MFGSVFGTVKEIVVNPHCDDKQKQQQQQQQQQKNKLKIR